MHIYIYIYIWIYIYIYIYIYTHLSLCISLYLSLSLSIYIYIYIYIHIHQQTLVDKLAVKAAVRSGSLSIEAPSGGLVPPYRGDPSQSSLRKTSETPGEALPHSQCDVTSQQRPVFIFGSCMLRSLEAFVQSGISSFYGEGFHPFYNILYYTILYYTIHIDILYV